MDKNLVEEALNLARDLALEAGELLIERGRVHFEVSKKGPVNLVTEVDLASEELLVGGIRKHFPNHRILAEEKGSFDGDGPILWIIDPLDGTTNYAHRYPFYCVSIGLEFEGRVVAGVVYNPVSGECFWAREGGGAWLGETPIRVSAETSLVDSLLCTGFSYQAHEIETNLELFNNVMRKARSVRRDGAAALDLCFVACGRFDGFWEISLHPWDIAAGSLIVQEAGGRVSRFNGSPASIYDSEFLASNGLIHKGLAGLLSGT